MTIADSIKSSAIFGGQSSAGIAGFTGTPTVGQVLTVTLPAGIVGTLQFTRTLKAFPFTKANIAGAVANAVNTLSYTVQAGDVGYLVGCDASNQVWPSLTVDIAANVPDAPVIGAVSAGSATVTAAFAAPAGNGGSPVTSIDAFLFAGNTVVGVLLNATSPAIFTAAKGVVNDTTYTVKFRANNAIGAGTLSAASIGVTPTAMTAPTVVSPPAITGTPTYGSPTVATAAVFAGLPAPTVSYQWNIDGVPIGSPMSNGSQAAIYPTLLASDINKVLTRTDTAANSQGSISSTSAGVVVANAWAKKASVTGIFTANAPGYVYPSRIAMTDSKRTSLVIRNPNPDTVQYGAVAATNDHRDQYPGSWIDIPGGTEAVLTANSQQVWMRAKPFFTAATLTNTTGTTARVTRTAHGLVNGRTIAVEGASPSGYNTSSAVINVIDADTFEYQMATSPAACTTLPYIKPVYLQTIEVETTSSQ